MYKLKLIVDENGQNSISVDENIFVHKRDRQTCAVGLINNRTRKIRLIIVNDRTIGKIKNIILENIPKGKPYS